MKCERSLLFYFIFFLGFSFQSNTLLGANILVTVAADAGPNSFREAILWTSLNRYKVYNPILRTFLVCSRHPYTLVKNKKIFVYF